MAETVRDEADLLTLLGDGAAAHSTNRERIRDIIKSVPALVYPIVAAEVGLVTLANARYPYGDARRFGAVGDGSADDLTKLQAALTVAPFTGGVVRIPASSVHYKITDALLPLSNTRIVVEAGAIVRQYTANKNIFRIVQKDNCWLEGSGVLYGEGTWSSGWTGNGGHEDRGAQFLGCTNSGMRNLRVRNCGHSGVVVRGGTNVTISQVVVEGTHALSTVLHQGDNFQIGFWAADDATYGICDGIKFLLVEAFNTNQGYLTTCEGVDGGKQIEFIAPYLHDIIGQHGGYTARSNVTVSSPTIARCGLDAIKIYGSSAPTGVTKNTVVTGLNASDCPNGHGVLFEVASTSAASVQNCRANGVATNCSRGFAFSGDIRGCTADIVSDTMAQYHGYMADSGTPNAGPTGNVVRLVGRNSQKYGLLVDSSLSANNTFYVKVYRSGLDGTAATSPGIAVLNSTSLTLESPECIDDQSKMQYGLFINTNGKAKITGTPVMKGYTSNGIRVVAPGGCDWYASGAEFTDLTTAFLSNGDNVLPFTPLRIGKQTTTNSNITAWLLTLPDESSYTVEMIITGKLSGSAERASFKTSANFYRDAAGAAAQEGVEFGNSSRVSAGFLGTYTWGVSGNAARISVKSGAVATVDWTFHVQVVRQL